MNKKDVLDILEVIATDVYFKDYNIRKSDNCIICKTDYGYKRVSFSYYNSYDLSRNELALEITPAYEIRFNVLHKWFEKYSKRSLADQRDDYSIGFVGEMIGKKNEFYFLENRKEYEEDLHELYDEVVNNAKELFNKYETLNCYYNYYVDKVIKGERAFPIVGFEWVVEFLIATKLVAPSNYDYVKKIILERVEMMMSCGEPNIAKYYCDLQIILEDFESTDFTSGKWGKLPLSQDRPPVSREQ